MIHTVTGPIEKDELGVTLAHEHLHWNSRYSQLLYFDKMYNEKQIQDTKKLYDILLPVLKELYNQGCRSLIETSPPRGGQNLKLMQLLSEETKINIIPNTGLMFTRHVYKVFNENFSKQLAQRWIEDYENGLDKINGVTIKPSHIKILLPEKDNLPQVDREILKAAISASNSTGLPIHCHIIGAEAAEAVMDFLEKQDFNCEKFLWAHASYKDEEVSIESIKRALEMGIWLGFDMIKKDNYPKHFKLIQKSIENNYEDKILLSQDYDFYEQFTKLGNNHPCASIFKNFIPYCEDKGLSKYKILKIMTDNPANFYNI
mgnify:CR=1 FL=1